MNQINILKSSERNFTKGGRIVLIILITFHSACKKYLDKKPDSSQIVPDAIVDLQALLDNSSYMNNNNTSNYAQGTSDDIFVLDETLNTRTPNSRDAYIWKPFDYTWQNEWGAMYFAIYNSNLCLERINNISQNSQNSYSWNNVKGSALFFRSYYFLNLAWTYSKAYDETSASTDLGIPLRLNSDFNIPSTRANVAETYARILTDAKEAAQFLPDNPLHVLRPSKAAAYGLLARAYLSMREYDSAYKFADLCLSIKDALMDYKAMNPSSPVPFSAYNPETIFYSQDYTGFIQLTSSTTALIDTMLYKSYSLNDLRKTAYFEPRSGYQRFKGRYSGNVSIYSGITTDEMYLVRAECLARLGNKTGALNDLNKLLGKRYDATFVPVMTSTAEEALDTILIERRKELLFRGLRWIDIKRLNKEGRNIIPKRLVAGQTYTLPPNDDRYALPLPKDIIDQTGMPQN